MDSGAAESMVNEICIYVVPLSWKLYSGGSPRIYVVPLNMNTLQISKYMQSRAITCFSFVPYTPFHNN